MELDLTRLNSLAFMDFAETPPEKQPSKMLVEPRKEGGEYETIPSAKEPLQGLTEGLQGIGRLQREADQNKAEKDRILAIYQEYQRNIASSGQLQTEILKGAKAGEDIYSLFLKAVQAISLITSNTHFYSQLEADIKSIYGVGLLQPPPLREELRAVQERLTRLREALQRAGEPEDSLQRIRSAIKAHEAREYQIQGLLEK